MTEKFRISVEQAVKELTSEGLDQLAWLIDTFVEFYVQLPDDPGSDQSGPESVRNFIKKKLQ